MTPVLLIFFDTSELCACHANRRVSGHTCRVSVAWHPAPKTTKNPVTEIKTYFFPLDFNDPMALRCLSTQHIVPLSVRLCVRLAIQPCGQALAFSLRLEKRRWPWESPKKDSPQPSLPLVIPVDPVARFHGLGYEKRARNHVLQKGA